LGAYFASIDLAILFPELGAYGVNSFSAAAAMCWILLVLETAYIYVYFEETHPRFRSRMVSPVQELADSTNPTPPPERGIQMVAISGLHKLNFWHSFFFSGLEFVLPFLTFQRFGYTNRHQGYLLGSMGLVASLIQGGYTRRYARKVGEIKIATQGLFLAAIGFQAWAIVGTPFDVFSTGDVVGWTLMAGIVGFAFASATVSTCLASLVSFHSDHDDAEGNQGERMGRFRSSGQLGRALGPLVTCFIYWSTNAVFCFTLGAIGELALALLVMMRLRAVKPKTKHE
jgi:hypothetical protein